MSLLHAPPVHTHKVSRGLPQTPRCSFFSTGMKASHDCKLCSLCSLIFFLPGGVFSKCFNLKRSIYLVNLWFSACL